MIYKMPSFLEGIFLYLYEKPFNYVCTIFASIFIIDGKKDCF